MKEELSEMECIPVGSLEEQFAIMQKMSIMQRTHNALAQDFGTLAEFAKENVNNPGRIEPLIRACIKELFSLVEADLYLINQYLPYEGYNEMDSLSKKFKKTYRHHSRSFKKEQIKQQYQSKSYGRLYRLKQKRDEIVHPKGLHSIAVTLSNLDEVIVVYQEYRNYIIQLMTNIGFSVQLPIDWQLRK
jgi:hypothetical protein